MKKTLFAILFNSMIGLVLASAANFNPIIGILSVNGLAVLPSALHELGFIQDNTRVNSSLFIGLQKEIYLSDLKENFYPNGAFLSRATDMSAFVDNDKINLAEIGADPAVLKNSSTPIAVVDRNDTPIEIVLDRYDTENTPIPYADDVELSYNKTQSVIKQHRDAMLAHFSKIAAHNYAPDTNTTFSPIIAATGADDGTGLKKLTLEDVYKLKKSFDKFDAPTDRVLVLNPEHVQHILNEDKDLFKQYTNLAEGKVLRVAGFDIMEFSKTPRYDKTTLAKIPFGAAPSSDDAYASFCFVPSEVMKAMGTLDMFYSDKTIDPINRRTLVGFASRFIALPIRNKCIGALVSKKV